MFDREMRLGFKPISCQYISPVPNRPVPNRPVPNRPVPYVQLSHFIYFSPSSSASTEGEYGILEPKFPDGGHCQSVLRRQWVLFTSTLNVRVEGTSALRDMRATRSTPPN